MIRTLQLSKEVLTFLAVSGLLSVIYLALNTGDRTARGAGVVTTPSAFTAGGTFEVSITLVTADASSLSCAADETAGPAHCAYRLAGTPWTGPSGDADAAGSTGAANVIAPYMTTDNNLLLVTELWSEPALVTRLAEEPPANYEREQLRRFHANCKFHADQKINAVKVRWQATATGWDERKNVWVGHLSGCTVADG